MGEKRVDEAIARFQGALRARPEYAEAHNNLGIAFETRGRTAEAEAEYRAALQSRPSHAAAHNNLGRLLLAQGAVPQAAAEFRAALRTRPDHPDALYNLGRALMASGQTRDAVQQWKRAIAARPDSVVIALDLAWVLATRAEVQNTGEAIKLAERVNRATKGSNPAALDVLAAAYAADGRIDLAVRTAQLALQRAIAGKSDALAKEIRQRLLAYEEAANRSADSP
jgi:Tfp pilus assembly protein PilF